MGCWFGFICFFLVFRAFGRGLGCFVAPKVSEEFQPPEADEQKDLRSYVVHHRTTLEKPFEQNLETHRKTMKKTKKKQRKTIPKTIPIE